MILSKSSLLDQRLHHISATKNRKNTHTINLLYTRLLTIFINRPIGFIAIFSNFFLVNIAIKPLLLLHLNVNRLGMSIK